MEENDLEKMIIPKEQKEKLKKILQDSDLAKIEEGIKETEKALRKTKQLETQTTKEITEKTKVVAKIKKEKEDYEQLKEILERKIKTFQDFLDHPEESIEFFEGKITSQKSLEFVKGLGVILEPPTKAEETLSLAQSNYVIAKLLTVLFPKIDKVLDKLNGEKVA